MVAVMMTVLLLLLVVVVVVCVCVCVCFVCADTAQHPLPSTVPIKIITVLNILNTAVHMILCVNCFC